MIIVVGGRKGGVGKTTVAINLSAELVRRGLDLVLVDTDRQESAYNWSQYRSEDEGLPTVNCVQLYDNVTKQLLDLDKRYGYVIVDSPGRDALELRSSMLAADVLIIPFRPSQMDLDTMQAMQEVIKDTLVYNPNLTIVGVSTMASTNPVVNEVEEARRYLSEFPEIKMLDVVIHDRKIYRDSLIEGKGVVDMRNQKATDEIKTLVNITIGPPSAKEIKKGKGKK